MHNGKYVKSKSISEDLREAVKLEVWISDLLYDNYDCSSEEVIKAYGQAAEISPRLSQFEQFVVGAVGKTLWRDRVLDNEPPQAHPEYRTTMNDEIYKYLYKIHDFDPLQQKVALSILDKISVYQSMPPNLLAA